MKRPPVKFIEHEYAVGQRRGRTHVTIESWSARLIDPCSWQDLPLIAKTLVKVVSFLAQRLVSDAPTASGITDRAIQMKVPRGWGIARAMETTPVPMFLHLLESFLMPWRPSNMVRDLSARAFDQNRSEWTQFNYRGLRCSIGCDFEPWHRTLQLGVGGTSYVGGKETCSKEFLQLGGNAEWLVCVSAYRSTHRCLASSAGKTRHDSLRNRSSQPCFPYAVPVCEPITGTPPMMAAAVAPHFAGP